jgi:hypothetical protein
MTLDLGELAARARHLLGSLFTWWSVVGIVLAAALCALRRDGLSSRAREPLLLAASLAALAFLASLPVAVLWVAAALVFYALVEGGPRPGLALPLVLVFLAALVVAPVRAIEWLGRHGQREREFVAFATNMAALRAWAYFWDRWRRGAPREPLCRYLLAMLFFPTLVNGPLEVPRQLRDGWLAEGPAAAFAAGARRIGAGLAKLAVAGLAFRPGWTSVLANGADAPVWQLWVWGALFYGWFYLSFSAWTDVAVGLGRLAGRRVPENFDRPWAATDPADFWRRWHASFGVWLRDYVYVPLGGGRRRRALNVLVTFLVSAGWHVWGGVKLLGLGYFPPHAWDGFVLWGVLNAAGVLAARPLARLLAPAGAAGRLAGQVVTTAFECWCWIPFFLPAGVPLRTCLEMLRRMLWPF